MVFSVARQLPSTSASETTSNILWFDAIIRHQIFLIRSAKAISNEMIGVINKTEEGVRLLILSHISDLEGLELTQQLSLAAILLEKIRELRFQAHTTNKGFLVKGMDEFVTSEAVFAKTTFELVIPVVIDTTLPATAQLRALVREAPFEGRLLKHWADSIARSDLRRIDDAVKKGIVQGLTAKQIARDVLGTRAERGRNGLTQTTRRNIEGVARTAMNHFSNSARQEYYGLNKDVIQTEVYVATLDGVTTPICRSLDGRTYDTNTGPMPPVHFNCRSTRVVRIQDSLIGSRPTKPVVEKRLLKEFASDRKLGTITSRSQLPRGTKGAFDSYKRKRTRELIGRVPAKTTYGEWLKTQSVEFQDDVLGKTRGKLFRSGKVSLSKFVTRAGDEIPLAELAKRDSNAFIVAGIDPKDF